MSDGNEWLLARARLEPNLLSRSPPFVRGVFDHAWAPRQALAQQISALPEALWQYLMSFSSGFAFVHSGDSCYAPGPAAVRDLSVHNVAFIAVQDLALDNERPLHAIGHLIDHHLGSGGAPDGPWLSEGGGTAPFLHKAAMRLPSLYVLGYGIDGVAQANPRDYFAQSLATYVRDRRRLNVADPQIHKWFRSTLWSDAFWRGQEYDQEGEG